MGICTTCPRPTANKTGNPSQVRIGTIINGPPVPDSAEPAPVINPVNTKTIFEATRHDIHEQVGGGCGLLTGKEEEVGSLGRVPICGRHVSTQNAVGVLDDLALGRLAVDLSQSRRGDGARVQQITEYVARANRGQLVGISHQDQPGLAVQRLEQVMGENK